MKTASRAADDVRARGDIFEPRAFFVDRQITEFARKTGGSPNDA